ncbi:MAG: DUF1861 family protein [Sporolactobacillus sp.]|jgi:hypothetical protein|nr:DUF1861 family protein [Sporolactobacillus sp.]
MRRAADCRTLLAEYHRRHEPIYHVKKLRFAGVGDRDVYNITAPFKDESKHIIAGRVEKRDSEKSMTAFFEKKHGIWTMMKDMPTFPLQDPFVTRIDGLLVFGGVAVQDDGSGHLCWRTVLYRGTSVKNLEPFFAGPIGMKDLRLGQMPNGLILVLTRPQGLKGGRGKIGFFLLCDLSELSIEKIENAPLLEGHFAEGEWGGANGVFPLKNGDAGVLGHIAYFDEKGNRHYYPMIFTLDPLTGYHTPIEIIATRSDFIDGPAKRKDLQDVVFTGGGIRGNSRLILFVGTSDAEAQKIVINDPFKKYDIDWNSDELRRAVFVHEETIIIREDQWQDMAEGGFF